MILHNLGLRGVGLFVSLYNAYVHTNANDKTSKLKQNKEQKTSESFAARFLNKPILAKISSHTTPINYLQNANTFKNKQKLQPDLALKKGLLKTSKFNASSAIKNAKIAYRENSTIFSIVPKPQQVLGQIRTPKYPQSAINTYLANDKYYQTTA